MARIALPSDPRRKRLVLAASQQYRHLHIALRSQLEMLPDNQTRNVNVAQNVVRDVLTAVFAEMVPYTHETVVQLARRVASYALSVVPIEDQDAVMAKFLEGFADEHMDRTAGGAFIRTIWRMDDGRDLPNFPEER